MSHLPPGDIGDVDAELWYPRSPDRPKAVVVSLIDVRAADDIRISYDFDRDGWVIQQRSDVEPGPDVAWDEDPRLAWREVAFVKAWGLKP